MEEKKFKVIFSPPAQGDIDGHEAEDALQLVKDVKKYLETSPFPFGETRVKKLTGFVPPLYRLRSGNFRVYYRILFKEVIILAITHKKEREKFLKKAR